MNYDHTPRPEIEQHYHIRSLIESQEKRANDRAKHNDIEKSRDQNLKDIAGFKDFDTLDFYCKGCDRDFVSIGRKVIDSWKPIAYYTTKHECGRWAIRHITDRHQDEYFFRSRKVAKDRGEAFIDLIQPFESGYNMVYGKK